MDIADSEREVAALSPIDGLEAILSWSTTAPAWQRDALRRLCAGPDIEEADEADLLDVLKGAREADPLSAQHLRQAAAAHRAVTLKSITDVAFVNALAPNQVCSFAQKGMTVAYGDNGSGKSGYVRVLKAACRARLEKGFDIRPDIYSAEKGVPRATITYYDGPSRAKAIWTKGRPARPALSAINVFDSAAGSIHVGGPNDIAYTPFPLLVLARLARTADRLRTALTAEVNLLKGQIAETVAKQSCAPTSATGKLLRSLSGTTKPADVEALATLSDTEMAELTALRKDLADDPAAIATRSARLAVRLDALRGSAASIAAALDDAAADRIMALKREIAAITRAVEVEASRRFTADPLPVGDPAWRALWGAAQVYSEAHEHLGGDGETCPLCQRPHDAESADRFRRFQAFAADELGQRLRTAEEALEATPAFTGMEHLKVRRIVEIRDYLAQTGASELAQKLSRFLVRAAWRRRWLGRMSQEVPPALTPPPLDEIAAAADALRTKAQSLQGSAQRQAMRERYDELADREWLGIVREDVLKAIHLKSRILALEALLPQTARARITNQSTVLAKGLVTDRLRDRFASEVSELGISRLRVELRQESSAAGQARFKVCFIAKPGESVSAVLSEGELRCLAIAAFLAELETAEGLSGIVLDDPISSLDHRHREKVAERLAQEALKRQVIVFTHDIPFLSQLQKACRSAAAPFLTRLISRGVQPGFCHEEGPLTHRPLKDAISATRNAIGNKRHLYETGNPAWDESVTEFGGTLRKLWERAVEEVVSPVLTRWTHSVDTPGFIQLTVLGTSDHTTMRAAYRQCSTWEHYQPAAGNIPQPSVDDLLQEADKLAAWLAGIKARQEAA